MGEVFVFWGDLVPAIFDAFPHLGFALVQDGPCAVCGFIVGRADIGIWFRVSFEVLCPDGSREDYVDASALMFGERESPSALDNPCG